MVDKILIVDDEKHITETIQSYFKQRGYSPLVAKDAEEAINLLKKKNDINLVITDVHMPGEKNGISLLEEIKQDISPLCQVIIITGYPNVSGAVKAMEGGAFTYLTKPFEFADLHRAVERAQKRQEETIVKMRQEMQKNSLAGLGELFGGLAHNLMNPIQAVIGYAELSLEEKRKNQVDEYLKKIIESAIKMQTAIKSLLSKVREGYSDEVVPVDLNKMILDELEILQSNMFFKHEVETVLLLEDDLPLITGIYVDFSQAFLNLVSNALDAMFYSPIKRLLISTRSTAKHAVITVEDSGVGIPGENIDKIFLPSFTTKAKKGEKNSTPAGTGLGLFSAQQIIETYKGTITVKSQPQKTVFTVKIPNSLEKSLVIMGVDLPAD